MSDGAAAVLVMRRSVANRLNIPVLGVIRGYKVQGVKPDEMGIGPAAAIPALLQSTGKSYTYTYIYILYIHEHIHINEVLG